MAENKFEQIEQMAKWVASHKDEVRAEGKSILIFINDDKERKIINVFAGDIVSLIRLHNDMEEEINKALPDVLGVLLEDLKKKLEDK